MAGLATGASAQERVATSRLDRSVCDARLAIVALAVVDGNGRPLDSARVSLTRVRDGRLVLRRARRIGDGLFELASDQGVTISDGDTASAPIPGVRMLLGIRPTRFRATVRFGRTRRVVDQWLALTPDGCHVTRTRGVDTVRFRP
jgi:hypothetical protein